MTTPHGSFCLIIKVSDVLGLPIEQNQTLCRSVYLETDQDRWLIPVEATYTYSQSGRGGPWSRIFGWLSPASACIQKFCRVCSFLLRNKKICLKALSQIPTGLSDMVSDMVIWCIWYGDIWYGDMVISDISDMVKQGIYTPFSILELFSWATKNLDLCPQDHSQNLGMSCFLTDFWVFLYAMQFWVIMFLYYMWLYSSETN